MAIICIWTHRVTRGKNLKIDEMLMPAGTQKEQLNNTKSYDKTKFKSKSLLHENTRD